MAPKIDVYSRGICHCSVCAPVDVPGDEVARRVEAIEPAGTTNGWTLSEDPTFSDGVTPNGGIVQCPNGTTRHWLLSC